MSVVQVSVASSSVFLSYLLFIIMSIVGDKYLILFILPLEKKKCAGFFNISQHSDHDVDNDVVSIDNQMNSMDDDDDDDDDDDNDDE